MPTVHVSVKSDRRKDSDDDTKLFLRKYGQVLNTVKTLLTASRSFRHKGNFKLPLSCSVGGLGLSGRLSLLLFFLLPSSHFQ